MNIVKLNVLHLHLTDSESFAYESKFNPNITKYGSNGEGWYHTVADLNELVDFGRNYSVIIIPEVDSPGHTKALTSPPEYNKLDACFGYDPKDWTKLCL